MAVSFTVCEIAWKGSVSSLPVHHPPSEPVPACTRQRWDPLVVPRRSWCSTDLSEQARRGRSRPRARRHSLRFTGRAMSRITVLRLIPNRSAICAMAQPSR